MSERTAYSTALHSHSHPMHYNTVIPEQAFSLQGCCTLRAKAPLSPAPKLHYFTKYLNHVSPIFTRQLFPFISLLPDQGTEGELWLKYKNASLPWTMRWMKWERSLQTLCTEPSPIQGTARHCSTRFHRQWGPLAHTNLFPDWRFLNLEGHNLMWEAVSRSYLQCCPSYPSTTKITSFILISSESPEAQAMQPHWEQTPPNMASNNDTVAWAQQLEWFPLLFLSRSESTFSPFLPGTQTPAEGKIYLSRKIMAWGLH